MTSLSLGYKYDHTGKIPFCYSSLWERPENTVKMCEETLSCTNQAMEKKTKKTSKPISFPFSPPGQQLRSLKQHEMLRVNLEEDVCVPPRAVRRMVRLAKESPRITAGELERPVESWG